MTLFFSILWFPFNFLRFFFRLNAVIGWELKISFRDLFISSKFQCFRIHLLKMRLIYSLGNMYQGNRFLWFLFCLKERSSSNLQKFYFCFLFHKILKIYELIAYKNQYNFFMINFKLIWINDIHGLLPQEDSEIKFGVMGWPVSSWASPYGDSLRKSN